MLSVAKKINNKYLKFKNGDIERISKNKNIFAKFYIPNWSEEVFVIKKVKSTVLWRYIIIDLNEEEALGTVFKNRIAKINSK